MGTRLPQFSDLSAEMLAQGYRVRFHATGRSMMPTICDGDAILVEAVVPEKIRIGDIVLYRSPRGLLAHRIIRIVHNSSVVSRISSFGADSSAFSVPHSAFCFQPSAPCSQHFITRGDASFTNDALVTGEQILGRVILVERQGMLNPLTGVRELIRYRVREQVRRLRRSVAACLRP
jgi:hypothetical protein